MLSAPEESLRPSPTALSGLSPEVSIQLSLGLRALKEELSSPMAARAVLTPLRGVLARQPAAGVSTEPNFLRSVNSDCLDLDVDCGVGARWMRDQCSESCALVWD